MDLFALVVDAAGFGVEGDLRAPAGSERLPDRGHGVAQLAGVLEALLLLLGQAALDHLDEHRGQLSDPALEVRRVLVDHLEQHPVHRLGLERLLP